MSKCSNCGAEYTEKDKFCSQCGDKRILEEPKPPETVAPERETPQIETSDEPAGQDVKEPVKEEPKKPSFLEPLKKLKLKVVTAKLSRAFIVALIFMFLTSAVAAAFYAKSLDWVKEETLKYEDYSKKADELKSTNNKLTLDLKDLQGKYGKEADTKANLDKIVKQKEAPYQQALNDYNQVKAKIDLQLNQLENLKSQYGYNGYTNAQIKATRNQVLQDIPKLQNALSTENSNLKTNENSLSSVRSNIVNWQNKATTYKASYDSLTSDINSKVTTYNSAKSDYDRDVQTYNGYTQEVSQIKSRLGDNLAKFLLYIGLHTIVASGSGGTLNPVLEVAMRAFGLSSNDILNSWNDIKRWNDLDSNLIPNLVNEINSEYAYLKQLGQQIDGLKSQANTVYNNWQTSLTTVAQFQNQERSIQQEISRIQNKISELSTSLANSQTKLNQLNSMFGVIQEIERIAPQFEEVEATKSAKYNDYKVALDSYNRQSELVTKLNNQIADTQNNINTNEGKIATYQASAQESLNRARTYEDMRVPSLVVSILSFLGALGPALFRLTRPLPT